MQHEPELVPEVTSIMFVEAFFEKATRRTNSFRPGLGPRYEEHAYTWCPKQARRLQAHARAGKTWNHL